MIRPTDISKFGIEALTPMQECMRSKATTPGSIVLLSPTGSGKTIAFLLPICDLIDSSNSQLQAIIVTPTRELAQQNEEVLAKAKTGIRSVSVFGGRPTMQEHRIINDVKPHVIFGTPGRLNDHLSKENFATHDVKVLVIDEFDKCIELGFRSEMEQLIGYFKGITHCWLTSATKSDDIADFAHTSGLKALSHPTYLDFLPKESETDTRIACHFVRSPQKDKLQTLGKLLTDANGEPTIIFVNHRESVDRTNKWLHEQGFASVAYHGGMEQEWRERSLYKFRSGAANVLVSTDLAARGLDIPEVKHIVHYHLPLKREDYIHRNGRSARWQNEGSAYIVLGPEEALPTFAAEVSEAPVKATRIEPRQPDFTTLYIGRGKRDKLSKTDVLGFLCKKGQLTASDIGRIDIGPHYAYVAVRRKKVRTMLSLVANEKIKGMKTLIEEMRK